MNTAMQQPMETDVAMMYSSTVQTNNYSNFRETTSFIESLTAHTARVVKHTRPTASTANEHLPLNVKNTYSPVCSLVVLHPRDTGLQFNRDGNEVRRKLLGYAEDGLARAEETTSNSL